MVVGPFQLDRNRRYLVGIVAEVGMSVEREEGRHLSLKRQSLSAKFSMSQYKIT